MDSDIWSDICKRQQQTELSEHSYTDGFVTLEDLEDEDGEAPEDVACPFCFKDFDIEVLRHHIHDEHCFQINSRWGKESKEGRTHYFYTGATMNVSSDSLCVSLDPLLSCFVYNMACSEAKKQPATSLSSGGSPQKNSTSNVEVITSAEERKRFEEVSGRVMFVQHLVLSTILGDEF